MAWETLLQFDRVILMELLCDIVISWFSSHITNHCSAIVSCYIVTAIRINTYDRNHSVLQGFNVQRPINIKRFKHYKGRFSFTGTRSFSVAVRSFNPKHFIQQSSIKTVVSSEYVPHHIHLSMWQPSCLKTATHLLVSNFKPHVFMWLFNPFACRYVRKNLPRSEKYLIMKKSVKFL
jgi:hypothetical protein